MTRLSTHILHFKAAMILNFKYKNEKEIMTNWMKVDEIGWKWINGWKFIKWMKVDEKGWKWMKVDNMDESGQNGWKWMKMDENG